MNEVLEEIQELKKLLFISQKQVFNTDQAAEYLTISKDVLLRLARIGKIEYVKTEETISLKKEYLDKWLDRNKVGVM